MYIWASTNTVFLYVSWLHLKIFSYFHISYSLSLVGLPQWGARYSNGPQCPSVCHTRISPKLSEIDVWLLWNSVKNLGFLIQNLPLDLQVEVWFRHFGCFCVGTSSVLRWSLVIVCFSLAVCLLCMHVKLSVFVCIFSGFATNLNLQNLNVFVRGL